jgi:ABC-2 type transport system ATP-binding protein
VSRAANNTDDVERPGSALEARELTHAFQQPALVDVTLHASSGEIHALLGPNGAGKTTLLRVLAGLLRPQAGSLRVNGVDGLRHPRAIRKHVGLMPSGDGTLYRRLSGLENLVFFARLQGFRRREAITRATAVLEQVGLSEHRHKHVHAYSHGMQKRLSFGRALLTQPSILLIDEATHDLDPRAARVVRDLTVAAAARGSAVVWATQRLDEIRGFAHHVTLLGHGSVRYSGSVAGLLGRAVPTRYLLRLQNGGTPKAELTRTLDRALGAAGSVCAAPRASEEDYVLVLQDGHVIGDALNAFNSAGVRILTCREERSGIEDAFLALTEDRR